jgi:hypothetical protein
MVRAHHGGGNVASGIEPSRCRATSPSDLPSPFRETIRAAWKASGWPPPGEPETLDELISLLRHARTLFPSPLLAQSGLSLSRSGAVA